MSLPRAPLDCTRGPLLSTCFCLESLQWFLQLVQVHPRPTPAIKCPADARGQCFVLSLLLAGLLTQPWCYISVRLGCSSARQIESVRVLKPFPGHNPLQTLSRSQYGFDVMALKPRKLRFDCRIRRSHSYRTALFTRSLRSAPRRRA